MRLLWLFLLTTVAGVLLSTPAAAQSGFSVSAPPAQIDAAADGAHPFFLDVAESAESMRVISVGSSGIVSQDAEGVYSHRAQGVVIATFVSASGRFVAVVSKSDVEGARSTDLSLDLLDGRLERRYRVLLPYLFDEPLPTIVIDDADGSSAVVFHAQGRILFLSDGGDELATRSLADGSYDIERTLVVGRAARSDLLAVAVNDPTEDGVRSVVAERVRFFDSSGEERGGFAIPRLTVGSLGVSPDGRTVAVGSYDVASDVYRTSFFNTSGTEEYRVELAAERIDFGDEGDRVLIADKKRLAVVAPRSGVTLLESRWPQDANRLLGVALSGDGRYAVALAGTSSFEAGKFALSNLELSEFVQQPSGDFAPRVRPLPGMAGSVAVDIDGAGIAVGLDGSVLLFRRP